LRIAVACEDEAHHALATALTDNIVLDQSRVEGATWIADSLAYLRVYCGLAGQEDFYRLSNLKKDAASFRDQVTINGRVVKLRGHVDGRPLEPEAGMWRRCLILFATQRPIPDVLVVLHDTDGDRDRLKGLDQALHIAEGFGYHVIVGAPHQDAEGWFVAGFVPQNDHEKGRLAAIKSELGFDPSEEPHRLTAHPNEARTDAKRVLRVLVFDEDRSRPPSAGELPDLCVRTLSNLDLLERRGKDAGLAVFLQRLRSGIPPRLMGVR
jgi:hypothetical protein